MQKYNYAEIIIIGIINFIIIVCHAELNAILNKNTSDVKGCTIYVVLFPCNECAKLIIQSGIVTVLYVSDKYHDNVEMIASRKLLDMAGVKCRYYLVLYTVKPRTCGRDLRNCP